MSVTVWLTGIPASGKSTIANELVKHIDAQILDGDIIRQGICAGLGFSKEDRDENIRRISLVAGLLNRNGVNVVVAAVSPYREAREKARAQIENFCEVFVFCPLSRASLRDPKGLYAEAVKGRMEGLTGFDAPYEVPDHPEIALDTVSLSVGECCEKILRLLKGYKVPLRAVRYAMFIGRWSPFHNGHEHIIRKSLNRGVPVCVAVRNTPLSEEDPYTMEQRVRMIEAVFADDDVVVQSIPDILSINIGRKVGYDVNFVEVPEEIGGVSGTEVREMMAVGNDFWKTLVPAAVVEVLDSF